MPITVLCPGCNARFTVNEKFAGKKGPCPKCKQIITVPAAPAVQQQEVKIHAPEDFKDAGKDKKGRPISKPLPRRETELKPAAVAASAVGTLAVLALALLLRGVDDKDYKVPFVMLGLTIVSPPLTAAAYAFLRDDELEPYTGRSLWLRAAICALVYALLWGVYALLPGDLVGEMWQWLFVAPIFACAGAAAAWASFDLDFGNGLFHYSFYVLITLLLRSLIGLPPVWTSST